MKATGFVCHVDKEGHLILPNEIKEKFNLKTESKLDIFFDDIEEDKLILMKQEEDDYTKLKDFIDEFSKNLIKRINEYGCYQVDPLTIKYIRRYLKNITNLIDEEFQ